MEISEQTRLKKILKRNGAVGKRKMTLASEALEYLQQYDTSRSWVDNIKSPATKKRYARLFFEFCAEVAKSPDELAKLNPTQSEMMLEVDCSKLVRYNKTYVLYGFVVDVVGGGLLVNQFPVTSSDTNFYSNSKLTANNNRLISGDVS